jgi:hypothetical protein
MLGGPLGSTGGSRALAPAMSRPVAGKGDITIRVSRSDREIVSDAAKERKKRARRAKKAAKT